MQYVPGQRSSDRPDIRQRHAAVLKPPSEQFALAALNAITAHLAVVDSAGRIVAVNRAWQQFSERNGADPAAVLEGANYLAVCDAAAATGDVDASVAASMIRDVADGVRPSGFLEYPCNEPLLSRHFRLQVTRFIVAGETYMVLAHDEVTGRSAIEQSLRTSEARLNLALQAGRMYIWEHDLQTNYVTRSGNCLAVIGLGSGPSSEFAARLHSDDGFQAPELIRGDWGDEGNSREFRFVRPDGRTIWLAARSVTTTNESGVARRIGVTFDITDRKAVEERVWHMANHDSLTGLPNRARFHRKFTKALATAQADGTALSLLLIDLDDFKNVNDTLGHDAGDAVLRATAERLRTIVGSEDIVARLGGDEFAIVIFKPGTLANATALADQLVGSLGAPFDYQGRCLDNRISIGIAAELTQSGSASDLLKFADVALYNAKATGRNRAVVYQPWMTTVIEERGTVLRAVRDALETGAIIPYYQPRVNLRTGEIVGFEALARWRHPTRGLLSPETFSIAFDDPSLSQMIGATMLRQLCADVRSWRCHGLDPGRVALNFSAAEFGIPHLAEQVLATLADGGVSPTMFEVEITEGVLIGHNAGMVGEALRAFQDAGVLVAFDDFGTGFASLTHLKRFRVDHLKIDRSFVSRLEEDVSDQAIVSAVITLGKNLDMTVTAEGVETANQAAWLLLAGCDNAQGYLYSKPIAASRLPWLLKNWSKTVTACKPDQGDSLLKTA